MSSSSAAGVVAAARRLLGGVRSPLLAGFLERWPEGAPRCSPVSPSALPVLRHLQAAAHRAPAFSASFAGVLGAAAHALAWHRSYAPALVGEEFWDNYGWTELVGLAGPLPNPRLACGVLLLGPATTYPPHHHEAEEIYFPLSGTAHWKLGTSPWQPQPPGSVIHHPSQESHAMRTGPEPLLAMYLWRSDNLAQESRLDTEGVQEVRGV